MIDKLYEKLQSKFSKMQEIRQHLHEYPELSFEEVETAKYIADFYKDLDVGVRTDVGGRGVVVTIDSGKPGKTIALRADFDALPVQEDTGLPFASKNPGVMHACGHDAHSAYLMILAESLAELKDELVGKIVILHQHAEEVPPGGAIQMIEDGALDGVDNIFGCHVMSQMDYGNVYYHVGPTQQARAKFTVKIQGVGGHGAAPHEANDALICASYMVTALQTIVSRRINPFEPGVVTIGSLTGEGTFNIIKDSVEIVGDVRCMSDNVREIIEENVVRIAEGIGHAFNCDIEVDYVNDYPVLVNDEEMTLLAKEAVEEAPIDELKAVLDSGQMPPSEDFAYYSQERPSCFLYIGAKPVDKEAFPHHHPKFDVEEKSMLLAAKTIGATVLRYMGLF